MVQSSYNQEPWEKQVQPYGSMCQSLSTVRFAPEEDRQELWYSLTRTRREIFVRVFVVCFVISTMPTGKQENGIPVARWFPFVC